jgi:hypothetical protein
MRRVQISRTAEERPARIALSSGARLKCAVAYRRDSWLVVSRQSRHHEEKIRRLVLAAVSRMAQAGIEANVLTSSSLMRDAYRLRRGKRNRLQSQ